MLVPYFRKVFGYLPSGRVFEMLLMCLADKKMIEREKITEKILESMSLYSINVIKNDYKSWFI